MSVGVIVKQARGNLIARSAHGPTLVVSNSPCACNCISTATGRLLRGCTAILTAVTAKVCRSSTKAYVLSATGEPEFHTDRISNSKHLVDKGLPRQGRIAHIVRRHRKNLCNYRLHSIVDRTRKTRKFHNIPTRKEK
jgi:hypothetical protein